MQREGLKCAELVCGEQCVMTCGQHQKHQWYADNSTTLCMVRPNVL